MPRSTQRAIIEHYLKVVSPEYALLPAERESALLVHENPLKWSSANKDDADALALSIVFAVSSALITRDLDSSLSNLSMRCIEHVHKLSQTVTSAESRTEAIRWTCTFLCALALCELIIPTSGQLWDLLGRATSVIEDLREEYQLAHVNVDGAFDDWSTPSSSWRGRFSKPIFESLLKNYSVAPLRSTFDGIHHFVP